MRKASSSAGLPCFSSQACMSYLSVASSRQVLDSGPMISRALAAVMGSSGDGGTGGPEGGGSSRPVAKLSQAARPSAAATAMTTMLDFIGTPPVRVSGGHNRGRLSMPRASKTGRGSLPGPFDESPEGRFVLT